MPRLRLLFWSAYDGLEGLQIIAERIPDLALLDVEMPFLTGPELCDRLLSRDEGQEKIPIIFLSGVVNLAKVASSSGTPYYVTKPYNLDQVLKVIARALLKRRAPERRR